MRNENGRWRKMVRVGSSELRKETIKEQMIDSREWT